MKKLWMALTLLTFPLILSAHGNERGNAEATLEGNKIEVEYGRPMLKGRDLLGQVKEGMEWRVGADKSTTLSTEVDLVSKGIMIPRGTYSLVARNVGSEWLLIFNDSPNIRGTSRDLGKDVAAIPLEREEISKSTEMLTIELEPVNERMVNLSLSWGNTRLTARLQVASS